MAQSMEQVSNAIVRVLSINGTQGSTLQIPENAQPRSDTPLTAAWYNVGKELVVCFTCLLVTKVC